MSVDVVLVVLVVLDPERLPDDHEALVELARIALAVSLVSTGLQFTRGPPRRAADEYAGRSR